MAGRRTKRKTPALVAYLKGDRLMGEEAAAVAARVPDLALGQLRDFLGVRADSPGVAALLADHHLPWKVVPAKGRGTVAFQLGAGDPVTVEEAVVRCSAPSCAGRHHAVQLSQRFTSCLRAHTSAAAPRSPRCPFDDRCSGGGR